MFDPTNIGLFVISTILLIALFVRHKYQYWSSNGVPYVQPIRFPFGNIKGAMEAEHLSDILSRYYTQFKGDGPFIGIYFLLRRVILAVDINFIKRVLVKDFHAFENRGIFYNERDDPLSAHLFSIESSLWRKLRSKLTSTFTSGKMKFMYGTIIEVADRFRTVLDGHVEGAAADGVGGPLEMRELLGRFTVDVIGTTAFGIDCNCLADPSAKFLRMGRRMFDQPRHHPLVIFTIDCFPKLARALRVKALPDDVGSFFMNIVQQTVAYREKNQVRRNDFMDLLVRLKNEPKYVGDELLTLNEIAAQAFVFFLAGFETSATTMTFALYELASNVDVQQRVREEIEEVLRQHDGEFTYEAMLDMQYLEQVINETLRKYPPVPLLNRQTSKEYHVPEYNYTIPKETPIWIPSLAIHMDPEFYPNPERFDPDRFTAEAVSERNPLTFLPFGDGPRNCIGLRFGMMQVRIGLVTLLRRFQFNINAKRTTHPMRLSKKDFILAPEGGELWLDVVKIEAAN